MALSVVTRGLGGTALPTDGIGTTTTTAVVGVDTATAAEADLIGVASSDTAAVRDAVSTPMRLIVPAYFYPVRPGDWDIVIATMPGRGDVIVNDRSGGLAGQTADANYTTVIGDANTAGLSLLYYVDTNYAVRTLADVKADMDAWVSLYGAPAGWFFDQASSSATDIPYYQDLYDYASGLRVVLNHGTTPDETYISLSGPNQVCDTSIIAETDATTLATWSWPSWLTSYSRDRFGVIVHDAATSSDLTTAWSIIAAHWVDWAFVTSNTYAALPSYWSDELGLTGAPEVSGYTASESTGLADDLTFDISTILADGVGLVDSRTLDIATILADPIGSADSVSLLCALALADGVGLADSVSRSRPLLIDALTVTDEDRTRIMRSNVFTRLEVR